MNFALSAYKTIAYMLPLHWVELCPPETKSNEGLSYIYAHHPHHGGEKMLYKVLIGFNDWYVLYLCIITLWVKMKKVHLLYENDSYNFSGLKNKGKN